MTAAAEGTSVEREHALHLLTEMLRIRRLEEKSAELYTEGEIRGFLHLYIGEEAIAVGAMQSLRPEDNVVATYREHGHALARGLPARSIMAEMFGKREGCSHGRGGSMHIFSGEHRFFGGNAIVAGGLPLAAGLALADKLRGRAALTACFFGEGAVAEGAFHEAINLAALWRLPVLFLCENNLYAMGTALSRSESQTDLCVKAASYSVPAAHVDGMDVLAVEAAVRDAAAAIRDGGEPRFLELHTYRLRAHSMFDAQLYRPKEEVEAWRKRGPIETFVPKLRALGVLDDAALAEIEAKVAAEVEDAVAFAEAGTCEPAQELLRDVYTEPAS